MRVFLSYSSADRPIAEKIHVALEAEGYDVFFDRDSLPAGESFDVRILEEIERSDFFIFLVSPTSIEAGAYTLTELGFARHRWAKPAGRVLPVVIRKIDLHALPVYLRAVTLLEPEGDVAAEVVATVHELGRRGWRRAKWVMMALAVIAGAVAISYYILQVREHECHLAASDARAFAGRMTDHANAAAQRERAIVEELRSLESSKASDFMNLMREGGPQYLDKRQQLVVRYLNKETELRKRLSLVVQEHNSLMSKLAQESHQYRAAVFARCLDSDDASSPEAELSFDKGEGIPSDSARDKRFEDFMNLAKELGELASRAAGAGGEPGKKLDSPRSRPTE
jgi:hypothetical protein